MAYVAWKVEIEFVDGVWTDVTADVDTIRTPIAVDSGDTAESSGDTGSLTVVFNNPIQEYTPGNQLSSRYPNFTSGKRIRVTDTILDQVIYIFTGYITYPSIEAWTQSSSTAPRDQTITISAVDRLAKIAGGRTFVGTLAEHIMANGHGALAYFWPLGETASPATAVVGLSTLTETQDVYATGFTPTDPELASITWAGGEPAPGDDLRCLDLQPARDIAASVFTASYSLRGAATIVLTAGEVVTFVAWIRVDDRYDSGHIMQMGNSIGGGAPAFTAELKFDATASFLHGAAFAPSGNWGGTVDASEHGGTGRMFPVALRFGFSPAVIELWAGSNVYTGSMGVVIPSTGTSVDVELGSQFDGCLSGIQLYVGTEADWTHDDFLAQYEVGLQGLERQTTGQRIRTILGYAGVPGSELGQIADGVSLMQRVTLKDRSPGDVLSEAVETEQGLLYAAGDGMPVFVDRIGLYNI